METLTDVTSDVEAAFEDMECCMERKNHGGNTAAYADLHGCCFGWICQSHYGTLLGELKYFRQMMLVNGCITCPTCGCPFTDFESWMKVYPL